MKKLSIAAIGLLAMAGLSADDAANNKLAWVSDLSFDAQFGFQSEHASRGRIDNRRVFTPSVEVGYEAFEKGRFYVGVDSAISARRCSSLINALNEEGGQMMLTGMNVALGDGTYNFVSPYIGMTYDITDVFSIDAGYVHNFWIGVPTLPPFTDFFDGNLFFNIKRETNEIYVGVMADVIASPALYTRYDFDRQEIAIEGSVSHSIDLSHYCTGLKLDLGAKIGFDSAKKPYGIEGMKDIIAIVIPTEQQSSGNDLQGFSKRLLKKSYFYYGLNADAVYNVNDNVKIKVGAELVGNTAKKDAWPNVFYPSIMIDYDDYGNPRGFSGIKGRRIGIWWKAAIDFSF